GIAGAVGARGADDQIVEAVAVHIAGRGDRCTGAVAAILAMEDEAALPRRHGGEVDGGGEAVGLAEHHVAVAGIDLRIGSAVGVLRADDQVAEAIAVHIAGGGNRGAGIILRVLAMDDEAALTCGHVAEVNGSVPRWHGRFLPVAAACRTPRRLVPPAQSNSY